MWGGQSDWGKAIFHVKSVPISCVFCKKDSWNSNTSFTVEAIFGEYVAIFLSTLPHWFTNERDATGNSLLLKYFQIFEFQIFPLDRNIFIVYKPMRYREILQGTLQIWFPKWMTYQCLRILSLLRRGRWISKLNQTSFYANIWAVSLFNNTDFNHI